MAMATFMDHLNERVQNKAISMLRPFRPRHVVEIGFGAGGFADKLNSDGMVDRYMGVEISDTMVRQFNRRLEAKRSPFRQTFFPYALRTRNQSIALVY